MLCIPEQASACQLQNSSAAEMKVSFKDGSLEQSAVHCRDVARKKEPVKEWANFGLARAEIVQAAQWFAENRDDITGAFIPELHRRFGLTPLEAIEAGKLAHRLQQETDGS